MFDLCLIRMHVCMVTCGCVRVYSVQVGYDHRAFTINNQRVLLQSGSIHYPRSTPDMWPRLMQLARAHGLSIQTWPQPDHAPYPAAPWPSGTRDVITTEKDAVKLRPDWASSVEQDAADPSQDSRPRVWVLPLDSRVPQDWFTAACDRTWGRAASPPPGRAPLPADEP